MGVLSPPLSYRAPLLVQWYSQGIFGDVRVCDFSVVAWAVAGRPREEVALRSPRVTLEFPAVTGGVEFPRAIHVVHVAPEGAKR